VGQLHPFPEEKFMTQYAIKDIKANPFRHIDRYPIHRDKVAALRESLRTTGFWDNVVARAKNGKAEIAYGHHRLAALKEEFGPNHKVNLIIRDLDDETMIQIMARENMEEWETSASVIQETVRAVVEAYGAGLISLRYEPPMKMNTTRIRYAPSFRAGVKPQSGAAPLHPYTGQVIGEFIGWVNRSGEAQDKVHYALNALEFIEEGLLKDSDFEGLTVTQAEVVVVEARKAKTRREAAARVHQLQAEQAEREAKQAERRREEAERDRKRREIEAAAARDTETRRRAEAEAKRHEQQRREAEETRKHAVKRQEVEQQKVKKFVEEGRRQTTVVGRAVSKGLRAGETGVKGAQAIAARVDTKMDQPPPRIEEFAKRLATELNSILDSGRDPRIAKLDQLVQYQEYLDDYTRADLARTLESISNRALDYARQFGGGSTRALTAKRS
jgi:flagellar biosynthesis GTPase FlhF